ncbi:unnamed protein product [Chrysoparadoxa australica]
MLPPIQPPAILLLRKPSPCTYLAEIAGVRMLAAVTVLLAALLGVDGAAISSQDLAKSAAGLSRSSPLKAAGTVENGVERAISLANLEQELEDINVMHKYDKRLERVVIVMPLNDQFDPPVGQFGNGHVQVSDRISLPKSVMMDVYTRGLDVPWQFEIQRVHRHGPGDYQLIDLPQPTKLDLTGVKDTPQLSKLTCSILDYRAPEQYIFVPDWMMKALRLKPRDIVRLTHVSVPQGSGLVVTLQPHSSEFSKLTNMDKILEEELRHYSSLTAGSTISFLFNPKPRGSRRKQSETKRFYFNVVSCTDAEGQEVPSICVQDSDVSTDWLPPLDSPQARKMRERLLAKLSGELEGDGPAGQGDGDGEGMPADEYDDSTEEDSDDD